MRKKNIVAYCELDDVQKSEAHVRILNILDVMKTAGMAVSVGKVEMAQACTYDLMSDGGIYWIECPSNFFER